MIKSRDVLFEAILTRLINYYCKPTTIIDLVFLISEDENQILEIVGDQHEEDINKIFLNGLFESNLTSDDFNYSYKIYSNKERCDDQYALYISGKTDLAKNLINTVIAFAIIDKTLN